MNARIRELLARVEEIESSKPSLDGMVALIETEKELVIQPLHVAKAMDGGLKPEVALQLVEHRLAVGRLIDGLFGQLDGAAPDGGSGNGAH